jgi:predicted aspartyl protease
MGHVRISARLANPNRRRETIEVEALVDTGATWTALPRDLANRLELDIVGQYTVRTATGPQTLDQWFAFLEYEGRLSVSGVLVSDDADALRIGTLTLSGLRLAWDPAEGRLVETEIRL